MEYKILEYVDDLDTRRALGLLPRRLDETRTWALWYTLRSHDGIVYDTATATLFNFRPHGYHEIRRPVTLDIVNDGLMVFNLYEFPYVHEVYGDNGSVLIDPVAKSAWATELRVLLK